MVTSNGNVKIADFSVSQVFEVIWTLPLWLPINIHRYSSLVTGSYPSIAAHYFHVQFFSPELAINMLSWIDMLFSIQNKQISLGLYNIIKSCMFHILISRCILHAPSKVVSWDICQFTLFNIMVLCRHVHLLNLLFFSCIFYAYPA